jgi:hypothetical protein
VGGFGGSGTGGVSHGGAGQGGSMAQGAGGLGGAGGVGGHGGVGQGGLGGDGGVAGTGGAGAAGGSGGAGGQGGEGGSGGGVSCADIVDDGDPCTIDRCDPSGALVRTTCSALDPTVSTTLYDALSFLFETEPLVQTGVAPGTIDVVAVAGITGRVVGPDGLGLSNVSVTILGHPEYGATLTDATGRYILAVNASHRLTLDLQAAGFIRAQRAVEAPMQHIAHAADVMLSVANASATFVDLEAITEPTPALGAVESDDAGPRQGALLFTPGTTAAMRFPDGSTQASSTLTVRITELTVGADGPRRMPGELPDNTAYTYAVDLQADEAVAGGAEHVSLSEPASYFLENFIGAPVGTAVPAGTYDYEQGLWVADPDGRVVQLVSISGGLADLDITGDGVVDSASAIEAIGISEDERAWLATRYAAGDGAVAHGDRPLLGGRPQQHEGLPCLRGAAGFPHHDRRHVLRGGGGRVGDRVHQPDLRGGRAGRGHAVQPALSQRPSTRARSRAPCDGADHRRHGVSRASRDRGAAARGGAADRAARRVPMLAQPEHDDRVGRAGPVRAHNARAPAGGDRARLRVPVGEQSTFAAGWTGSPHSGLGCPTSSWTSTMCATSLRSGRADGSILDARATRSTGSGGSHWTPCTPTIRRAAPCTAGTAHAAAAMR